MSPDAPNAPPAAAEPPEPRGGGARGRWVAVEFRVRYSETDQMGVVHHPEYLVWCEIGRTEYIRAAGRTYAELERDGLALAVAEVSVRYHASARYDERVRVETSLEGVRSRALTFEYRIVNAETGARYATARTTLVAMDRSGRATSIPVALRAQLAAVAGAADAG